MRILVGKVFGIGNAVLAVPMIKALQYKPDAVVDILIGNTPDDVGAFQVLSKVVRPPGRIFAGSALEGDYDVAIMSIPFDGRWKNGVHFRAKEVLDGRTRPDPSTTGLVSWKKHEIDYQMENARKLGYQDYTPTTSFLKYDRESRDSKMIYLGVGYKKDEADFWKVKHWGNKNFAAFVKLFLQKNPDMQVVTSGDIADVALSIFPICRIVNDSRLYYSKTIDLDDAFQTVASCCAYVGNDTGMMHVAASCGIPTLGLFFMGPQSVVKSRPIYDSNSIFCSTIQDKDKSKVTPERVMSELEDMLGHREAE